MDVSGITEDQLQKVRDIFRNYLKERSQRQTPERFAVLEEIYQLPGHFDADELLVRLQTRGARVSRATVYNTLDLLLDCDLVVRRQFGTKQAKYERAHRYRQHDHLICVDCGSLFEFCDPRIQVIQEMVADIFKFDVTHHALNLYGHCKRTDCPNRPKH